MADSANSDKYLS